MLPVNDASNNFPCVSELILKKKNSIAKVKQPSKKHKETKTVLSINSYIKTTYTKTK